MHALMMSGPSQGVDRTEVREIEEPRPGPVKRREQSWHTKKQAVALETAAIPSRSGSASSVSAASK